MAASKHPFKLVRVDPDRSCDGGVGTGSCWSTHMEPHHRASRAESATRAYSELNLQVQAPPSRWGANALPAAGTTLLTPGNLVHSGHLSLSQELQRTSAVRSIGHEVEPDNRRKRRGPYPSAFLRLGLVERVWLVLELPTWSSRSARRVPSSRWDVRLLGRVQTLPTRLPVWRRPPERTWKM